MTKPVSEWTNPDKIRAKKLFESSKMRAVIRGLIEQERGTILVDSIEDPKVAMWSYSIMSSAVGDSSTEAARYLIEEFPYLHLLNVPDKNWESLVRKTWGEDIYAMPRTTLSAEALDIDHLRRLKKTLPEGFTLQKVDREALSNLAEKTMGFHIPQYFGSPEEFIKYGFGFCIKHGKRAVSMASTYTPYDDEIEIEIDTFDSPEYRRRGLATVAGAALIEYALENGLTPNWDAQTSISVELAKKLGYINPVPYEAFFRVKEGDIEKLRAALA